MEIFYSPQFRHEYRELSVEIRGKAKKKEKIFRTNPFDSRLKTHKLGGRLVDFWSFYVDYRCRIIFKFIDKKKVLFYVIGDHSVYKKL